MESERYCRRLAWGHYENFPVMSWVLPRRLRQPFANVYAFCRWADDLGDEVGDPARASSLLAWWRSELERCFRGEADHPVFVALRPTIEEFQLPIEPFDDLISAFEQDQVVREYESRSQLLDYCRRSANPVGRIVLQLCDRSTTATVELSDAICTGLQLANFWQDVERDDAIGRIYLPREDRAKFGVTDAEFSQRRTTPEFAALLAEEVDWARNLLKQGQPLVGHLSGRLRIVIDLFVRGGLLILDEIERAEYRVWERRPTVSKRRLMGATWRSLGRTLAQNPLSKRDVC